MVFLFEVLLDADAALLALLAEPGCTCAADELIGPDGKQPGGEI